MPVLSQITEFLSYLHVIAVSLIGITTLFEAYAATPGYTDEEGHHDVATQLTHVCKLNSCLFVLFPCL